MEDVAEDAGEDGGGAGIERLGGGGGADVDEIHFESVWGGGGMSL